MPDFWYNAQHKIVRADFLRTLLLDFRFAFESQNKTFKVVFTNGCFDLLHKGHVEYLCKARNLGNCLVVGINDDDSVSRLKGPQRPVATLDSRQLVLAGLECVDYVVPFAQDTPLELIHLLRPDVLVKGGDYSRDTIVGADFVESYGGKVVTIPLVEGQSTTNLINKMKI